MWEPSERATFEHPAGATSTQNILSRFLAARQNTVNSSRKQRRTVMCFAHGVGASMVVAAFTVEGRNEPFCRATIQKGCFGLWILGRIDTKTVATLAYRVKKSSRLVKNDRNDRVHLFYKRDLSKMGVGAFRGARKFRKKSLRGERHRGPSNITPTQTSERTPFEHHRYSEAKPSNGPLPHKFSSPITNHVLALHTFFEIFPVSSIL